MGEKNVKSSWELFSKHKIPCFDTPEKAVQAFSYLATYQQNQELLKQTAVITTLNPTPNVDDAKTIIALAVKENRKTLTTIESKQILQAFHIPVVMPVNAATEEDAITSANSLGYPVVMKINSADITHKQDVGGVILNINNENDVRTSFNTIITNAKERAPQAKILGVTIEPMLKNANNRELMIGVIRDIVFGHVISFGAGGSLVEIIKDRALSLPPLNEFLAKKLIQQTKIATLLEKFRNMLPANMDAIVNVLLRVSEMVMALPEISEMDINPLIANDKEAVVLDARIIL